MPGSSSIDGSEHVGSTSGQRSRGRVVFASTTRAQELGLYTAQMVFGVTTEASQHGYDVGLWLAVPDTEGALSSTLPPTAVDGVIATGRVVSDPWILELATAGVPIVVIGRWSGVDGRVHCVDTDHEHGTELLLAHLAGLGRQRIAVITGPLDVADVILRLHTYERLRIELDLDLDPDLVVTGDFSAASGDEAMSRLLAHPDGAPDAVFAMNDAMAAGAIRCARAAGFRVPEDIAVAGFDAVIDPLLLPMSITTVRQDAAELGRRSIRALLDLIAGAQGGETEVMTIDLLLGESTLGKSPPRRHARRHLSPVRD
jgi:DNA-binding LacI/PurR family transcriptional regulator